MYEYPRDKHHDNLDFGLQCLLFWGGGAFNPKIEVNLFTSF